MGVGPKGPEVWCCPTPGGQSGTAGSRAGILHYDDPPDFRPHLWTIAESVGRKALPDYAAHVSRILTIQGAPCDPTPNEVIAAIIRGVGSSNQQL